MFSIRSSSKSHTISRHPAENQRATSGRKNRWTKVHLEFSRKLSESGKGSWDPSQSCTRLYVPPCKGKYSAFSTQCRGKSPTHYSVLHWKAHSSEPARDTCRSMCLATCRHLSNARGRTGPVTARTSGHKWPPRAEPKRTSTARR